MKDLINLASKLENMMSKAENIDNFIQRMSLLEAEVQQLRGIANESWVSVEKAANEIGKSPSAIRQIVKNPRKKMPKGKVWKQESKGASIYINLKEYRKSL
jgi:hypothetical protein